MGLKGFGGSGVHPNFMPLGSILVSGGFHGLPLVPVLTTICRVRQNNLVKASAN